MKTTKLIIGLLFLLMLGYTANAQSWDGTHIYAPQYTKHYKGSRMYAVKANGSEGGSEGFLLTRSSKGLHFTLGIMENSYGDFSRYGMFGVSLKEAKSFQVSAHFGYATNYNKAYFSKKNSARLYKHLPKSMADASYMPLFTMTYKHRITKHVGVQVNVSPSFINTGLYVQL